MAFAAALIGSFVLMAAILGVQPDLAAEARQPMFWAKAAFALGLAAAAFAATHRLARPGVRLGAVPAALVAPLAAMWILAAVVLVRAAPGERAGLFFGQTWLSCPFNITLLAAPVFVAALWALRGFAPTRLGLAGAAAGLAAGAAGAAVYTLHCPELAAPFLGVWYVLGMLIPAALGALIGPRVLRW